MCGDLKVKNRHFSKGAEIAGLDNDRPENAGLEIDGLDIGERFLAVRTKKHAQLLLPCPYSKVD